MRKVIGAKNCTLLLNKQALVYPPLEGGSKSLISGWGKNSLPRDKSRPTVLTFAQALEELFPFPQEAGMTK